MKEKLYTIPLMDAFRAEDECPFCYIERELEQHALDFVLGSEVSYMQDDIREETDKLGFCKEHMHKMFKYGNPLGSALILDTHLKRITKELEKEMKKFTITSKIGLVDRVKKDVGATVDNSNVSRFIHANEENCYVCNHIKKNYEHYMGAFFYLYKKGEKEFIDLVKSGKGFCFHHFADILDMAPLYLSGKEQDELRGILFPQMEENMKRIREELEWFEMKFDYRYKDADWKTSRDAVQRAMQKVVGGYPADDVYRQK